MRLGAFGGHWDNTPFASSVNGYLFNNYIAASGSTQKSLGLTLNRVVDGKPQYQDNFVTLANRAGFQTWWFSNQGQIGEYDTAIASIAKRADEVQFLKNGDFEANKNTQDEQLLKLTEQVLSVERSQPQLIVLHLMGSHPQACDRTKGKYTTFVQSKGDLMLSLQRDANRFAAGEALRPATEFRQSLSRSPIFPITVWHLKSAARRCSISPMMTNISRTSRCRLWCSPATIKRIR